MLLTEPGTTYGYCRGNDAEVRAGQRDGDGSALDPVRASEISSACRRGKRPDDREEIVNRASRAVIAEPTPPSGRCP